MFNLFQKRLLAPVLLGGMFLVPLFAFAVEGDVLWRQQSIYNSTGATAAPMKIAEYGGDVYSAGYLKGCIYFASTDSEWYMERRNGNTGAVIWQQRSNPTPSANCLMVFLVDSTGVYTAGYDSWSSFGWRIEKRSLSTGALQWSKLYSQGDSLQFLKFGAIDSTGIYLAGDGYNGDPTARVLKINKATGDPLWDKTSTGPCGDAQISSFFHDNTGVYYGFMGGCAGGPYQEKIEKRDLAAGNILWTKSGPIHGAPTAVFGQNIVGIGNDGLYVNGGLFIGTIGLSKRNKNTGDIIWSDATNLDWMMNVGTNAIYTMQYTGGCWFCAGGDYIFKKRDPADGHVLWSINVGSQAPLRLRQIYTDNTLYTYSGNLSPYSFRKYDLSSGEKKLDRSNFTLPGNITETVFAPYPDPVPLPDKIAFYAGKSDSMATGYWIYKHTLIPSATVDCSADIILGTQKWASCNATQNPQYWYPGVDATTADVNGWPYGALYDVDAANNWDYMNGFSPIDKPVCSSGYHVPSAAEWKEAGAAVGDNWSSLNHPALRLALKLPYAGYYDGSGNYAGINSEGNYWTSSCPGIIGAGCANVGFVPTGLPPWQSWGSMGHSVRCIADSPNPDLWADKPQLNGGTLTAGQTVTFKDDVKNIGTDKSNGAFNNRFQIDMGNNGSYSDAVDVILDANNSAATLFVGDNKTVVSPNWTAVVGTHRIRMCADLPPDPDGKILESNEGNNCGADYLFTVTSAPTTLSGLGCTIAANASTCSGSFTWNIQSATTPNLYNFTRGVQYTTNPSGTSISYPITSGPNIVQARDGVTSLIPITVTGGCTAGTSWNGTLCAAGASQCNDGSNNDPDAWTDYPDDPGCSSLADTDESDNPQCSDGIDNADPEDTLVDLADLGCADKYDTDETNLPITACSDDTDNDNDGLVDFDGNGNPALKDPGCTTAADNNEFNLKTIKPR